MPLLVFLAAAAVVLAVWMKFEARALGTIERKVALRKSSPALSILHLSDIHFSGRKPYLDRYFDRLAASRYDFIFVTGDIFDCEQGVPSCIENFKKLKAKYGIFVVFGNHDYFDYQLMDIVTMGLRGRQHPDTPQPVEVFQKALKEAGVRLLMNEQVQVDVEGHSFLIHGLDDPTTGKADIEKAMHNYDPKHVHILLTHTIDAFFYIGENEIDLSFSGHTHGGQIRLPVVGPLITHTKYGPEYADGLQMLKGAACSVSRGMATSRFFSFRFLCRPEAILLKVTGI